MIVKLKDGTTVETDNLVTVEQIQSVIDDLQLQVDILESAIGIMGAQFAGKHGSQIPRSFYQSKFLLKQRRREVQALSRKIISLKRASKHERRLTFDYYFVQVAGLRLSGDMFESICTDAKRMLDEAIQQQEVQP